MTDIIDISHESVLCDRLDKIAEELKRLADFFIATQKVVPEKASTTKNLPTVKELWEIEIFKVTEKAISYKFNGMIAWIPKKAITNLDNIVVNEGETVELELAEWFSLQWKEDTYGKK